MTSSSTGHSTAAPPASASLSPTPPLSVQPRAVLPDLGRHIASRFGYGVTPALTAEVADAGGIQRWFAQQLRPSELPDGTADAIAGWWPSLARTPADLWSRNVRGVEYGWEVMQDYQRWLLMRRLHTRRQLQEVMTEFWENHLNVPVEGDGVFVHRASYGAVIRQNSLGRFDQLLIAAITHPAMLIYLDAAVSTKEHPNENLGRELLELHTVGRGSYDEDDVKSSARILTGWHVDLWNTWAASYRTEDHWTGPVKVMGFTDPNPSPDGQALTRRYLSWLAWRPATARRIARKLCVKFVRDDPSDALVESLAQVYLANRTEIVPVLQALVASDEFKASRRMKVRDPGEDVVASYRAIGLTVTPPPATIPDNHVVNAILWQTHDLGAEPHNWPQPNGQPTDNASWSSPSRMVASLDMHYSLAGGWWPTVGVTYRTPASWLPATTPVALKDLVDSMSREILGRPASPTMVRACCLAVGYPEATQVTADHDIVKWNMQRLLTTFLDSPDHMIR